MSLHLGNLSPRIRKDELERVFRRFGRCTVQIKDGYGFAVFDFRGDAEKALRALKGRKICGQLIYLSWSNKQPKPPESFSRAGKSRDMQHGRISGRVDNSVHRNFYRSRGDYTPSNKQLDDGGARHKTVEVHDDGGSFNHNNVELDHCHQKEELLEEDRYIEPNHEDNGRWAEQFDNPLDINGGDAEMGFDRYEPDCVNEREEYESRSLGNNEGSPTGETSLNKSNRVHHADSVRGHYTCFKCGAAGHKMRDCPLKDPSHEKSLYRSGRRHDNETDCRSEGGEIEGPESRSGGRLRQRSRNSRSMRQHEANGKPSVSERNETNGRSSPLGDVSNRTKTKDYNRKRQRDRDYQIIQMLDDKKSKRLALFHRHSDHTSPHLGTRSKSVRPSLGSISRSRSVSPVQRSPSAKSRFKTRSERSRFRSIKSKSSSPSSSLSTSHDRLLSSSLDKEEVNLNASVDGASNSLFKEKVTAVWQESEPGIGDEKISINNKAKAGFSGYIDDSRCQLEEDLIERQQLELDLKDENATSINYAEVSLNGSLIDQIPRGQEESLVERQQLEPELRKNSLQIGDVPGRSEDLSSASEMQGDMEMNQSHNDNSSRSTVPLVSCEIKIPCPLVEPGGKDTASEQSSAKKLREVEELENGNGLGKMKSLEPAYESDPKAPIEACVGSHMRISVEELCKVLKHYDLKHPEKDELNLGVEDYFGSARLWPWALIYYRRLKKGPVSGEKNARRVAQNKAFGITDKYIGSSSAWGESIEQQ